MEIIIPKRLSVNDSDNLAESFYLYYSIRLFRYFELELANGYPF